MGKLVVEVVIGADKGRRIEVQDDRWVVVGRSKILDETVRVPLEEIEEYQQRIPLGDEEMSIVKAHHRRRGRKEVGRLENNRDQDVSLADDTVSRVHAVLYNHGGACGVIDLASTNGVFVAGNKVDEAELLEGSLVDLGNVRLQVKSVS